MVAEREEMFGKEGQCSYALACCPTLQGSRLSYLNGSHAILVVTRERSFDSYILNLITFSTLLWYKGCGCSHAILTFNVIRHRAQGKRSATSSRSFRIGMPFLATRHDHGGKFTIGLSSSRYLSILKRT